MFGDGSSYAILNCKIVLKVYEVQGGLSYSDGLELFGK